MKHFLGCLLIAGCTQGSSTDTAAVGGSSSLPVTQIEQIVGADGTVDNGVLSLSIERTDIGDVQGPRGITLTPSFEVAGDIYFQSIGHGKAIVNGDLALKEDEVNPFIQALIQNDLVFQAFHQHVPSQPQIWFVHYRGECDPIALAHSVRNAIDVTSTPLPQHAPPNPTTPLDPQKLATILHGTAQVGEDGVVTVDVPRKHGVTLGGVEIKPETGIANVIEFKPHDATTADVIADFSMDSDEVQPTVKAMLIDDDWYQGCLYNQETAEEPQLYFDHMAKTGDAYQLAHEIRAGLDRTDAQ